MQVSLMASQNYNSSVSAYHLTALLMQLMTVLHIILGDRGHNLGIIYILWRCHYLDRPRHVNCSGFDRKCRCFDW